MFKTTFKEEGKNYVMAFEGQLDTPSSVLASRDMRVLNNCEGHDITLDCTALDYISSSGMRLFLDLLKTTREKGSKLTIVGLNEDIRTVFDEVEFLTLFDIR